MKCIVDCGALLELLVTVTYVVDLFLSQRNGPLSNMVLQGMQFQRKGLHALCCVHACLRTALLRQKGVARMRTSKSKAKSFHAHSRKYLLGSSLR